jgi:GntR family transcriptional regulator
MRRQGAGTFVASRVEKNFSKLSSFTEDMISRGRIPRSEWLKRAEGSVTPEESLVLGLSPGTPVYRFHRIRFADDAPMALEYSTVPAFSLPAPEAVGSSLYEALDAARCRPARALQRLRAVLFTEEQAELLNVRPGDAGLLIERRGFLKDGRAVEFTQSFYRGDAYDFVAELNTQAS